MSGDAGPRECARFTQKHQKSTFFESLDGAVKWEKAVGDFPAQSGGGIGMMSKRHHFNDATGFGWIVFHFLALGSFDEGLQECPSEEKRKGEGGEGQGNSFETDVTEKGKRKDARRKGKRKQHSEQNEALCHEQHGERKQRYASTFN